jgi:hypothetical protein
MTNTPPASRARIHELAAQTTWTRAEITEFETLLYASLGLHFWDGLVAFFTNT